MPRKPDLSLIGQVYNNLEVLEYTSKVNSYGRKLYRCKCLLCGGERMATKANLIRGEIKDCGCTRHNLKEESYSLMGQKFGKLTIVGTKIVNNRTRYICKCECGRTTYVMPGAIKKGQTRSCGCGIAERVKELYVEGTAPCKLDGDRIRSNNSSGYTGVSFDKARSKWCAEIMFKKKKYFLGRYDFLEDAVKIRKIAEENIFGEFLKWYNTMYPKKK